MGFTMAASLNADPFTLFSSCASGGLADGLDAGSGDRPVGGWDLAVLPRRERIRRLLRRRRGPGPRPGDPSGDRRHSLPEQMSVLSQLCEGAISPVFFHQVVGVLPVLLLTLGIEFNYFRRTLTDAGQRAATAATVTVMAAGLVGALSTLPWDGQGCGDVLSSWHEYMAFLLAVQAIFTGWSLWCGCWSPARPTTSPVPTPCRSPDERRWS